MRKESLFIFVISIVLTLGIVGGLHYLYLQNQKQVPIEVLTKPCIRRHRYRQDLTKTQSAARRTAKIIKCTRPDGTVFYTNATRCAGADLNNRLSVTDFVKPIPQVTTTSKKRAHQNNPGLPSNH